MKLGKWTNRVYMSGKVDGIFNRTHKAVKNNVDRFLMNELDMLANKVMVFGGDNIYDDIENYCYIFL